MIWFLELNYNLLAITIVYYTSNYNKQAIVNDQLTK